MQARTQRTAVAAAVLLLTIETAPRLGGQSPAAGAPAGIRMVADEGEAARHWPRWRGPSGQGLVSGAGYPDRWSPTRIAP